MKKKIILFLSFLMMVLFLTGCAEEVTSDEIRYVTEIAQNVKDILNYELPEGYTYSIADETRNDQIVIETKHNTGNGDVVISFVFDISQEEVQLLNIKHDCGGTMVLPLIVSCCIAFIIGLFFGLASPRH